MLVNSLAAASDVVPISIQIAPLKYCHWPVAALLLLAVTAMPLNAPGEEAPPTGIWLSFWSEYWPAKSALMVWPTALGWSSKIVAESSVPSPETTGASLTAAMVIARVSWSCSLRAVAGEPRIVAGAGR